MRLFAAACVAVIHIIANRYDKDDAISCFLLIERSSLKDIVQYKSNIYKI